MKQQVLIISTIMLLAMMFACQQKKENTEHQHHAQPEQLPADTVKKSIPKEEHAMIGDAHITIKYHAPAVRGRQIWGGLVPYGEVWVAGAHRATSFEINKDFEIAGKKIPAGKYALFTIPGEEQWTFIINKKWDQHLADEYAEADDVLRLEVKAEQVENSMERLKYSITIDGSAALLTFRWEKIKLSIPFTIQ
jgi:hypothetical protein